MDQLARWNDAGLAITLSVNISAANLGEADLIERIESGLTNRKLPFGCLEIELTESAIMNQPDQALDMLHKFEAAGICLRLTTSAPA